MKKEITIPKPIFVKMGPGVKIERKEEGSGPLSKALLWIWGIIVFGTLTLSYSYTAMMCGVLGAALFCLMPIKQQVAVVVSPMFLMAHLVGSRIQADWVSGYEGYGLYLGLASVGLSAASLYFCKVYSAEFDESDEEEAKIEPKTQYKKANQKSFQEKSDNVFDGEFTKEFDEDPLGRH